MDELDFLDERKWKDKYRISWCNHCDTAIIVCPECKNTTCNGGGCDQCNEDFDDFNKNTKHSVYQYLTERERDIYFKCKDIQDLILTSLKSGKREIDFQTMAAEGYMSSRSKKMFETFLKTDNS